MTSLHQLRVGNFQFKTDFSHDKIRYEKIGLPVRSDIDRVFQNCIVSTAVSDDGIDLSTHTMD